MVWAYLIIMCLVWGAGIYIAESYERDLDDYAIPVLFVGILWIPAIIVFAGVCIGWGIKKLFLGRKKNEKENNKQEQKSK